MMAASRSSSVSYMPSVMSEALARDQKAAARYSNIWSRMLVHFLFALQPSASTMRQSIHVP